MREKFYYLLFIIIITGFIRVHAQTIIWVSEWNSDANNVPYDFEWINLLRTEGYNVLADTSETYEVLNTAKINALEASDLVIFSRNTNSNRYIDGGEIIQWNSINTPLILLNPYLTQNSRWQWIKSSTCTEYANESMMSVIESNHQIFKGIKTVNGCVDMINDAINNGQMTYILSSDMGNGTALAKIYNNGYVWIAEWKPGIAFNSETTQIPSEKRMLFTAGGSSGQQSGAMNLTDDGKQIFLNAVSYMLGGTASLEIAGEPRPENLQQGVSYKTDLSWKSRFYTDFHNVYLGLDFNDVNEAAIDEHPEGTVVQSLTRDVNYFDPGVLEFGKTYYWRVDEVNVSLSPGEYKGSIWSFTVEPEALKLPKEFITAAAKSSTDKNDPNKTINEAGLDLNTDLHSTAGCWLSGDASKADPAWIRYDFDRLFKIHEMLVWNYNGVMSSKYGFNKVLIEYSIDGASWISVDSVTSFAQGTSKPNYLYNTTVPFNDVVASSVRITALSTYENNNDYTKAGLAEVRFNIIPTRAIIPSPETGDKYVDIDKILSWREGREAARHDVYISTDLQAVLNGSVPVNTVTVNSYAPLLDFGRTYYWSVTEVNDIRTPSRWASDIWDFTTAEYATLDDFEDYNETAGREIYLTWEDGLTSGDNGSQIGYNESPYVETVTVQNGKQSAPISYDNSGEFEPSAAYSQVTRIFAAPLNLTVNGADTLRLYYRGRAITFGEMPGGYMALSAEGADIYGVSDEFRYAYKTLTGDGSIIARVDSIEYINEWSKAGIMIRNTLDANSAHAAVILAANGTSQFQRRIIKGGITINCDAAGAGSPAWVKLARSGNTFTAEHSKDGIIWESFESEPNASATAAIAMNNQVYIGIAVTSHTPNVLAAATLSEVTTSGNVSSGDWTVLPIGDIDQAEGENTIDTFYISIEDDTGNKAKVFGPGNAVGSAVWMRWLIPYSQLTGVDMSMVRKFSIGIGDSAAPAKGRGLIYIDNISYGHSLND